jgi:hypothetical protein
MWHVTLKREVQRGIKHLPETVRVALFALLREIEIAGPVRGNWPNYSKLAQNSHHCHLKKGRPTYVALWEVGDKRTKMIEVTYVGTHGRAPY